MWFAMECMVNILGLPSATRLGTGFRHKFTSKWVRSRVQSRGLCFICAYNRILPLLAGRDITRSDRIFPENSQFILKVDIDIKWWARVYLSRMFAYTCSRTVILPWSTSIRHPSGTYTSDWCLIDVEISIDWDLWIWIPRNIDSS